MGNESLTRKMLEDILDVKLMPAKAKIYDPTDQMKEFHKFVNEVLYMYSYFWKPNPLVFLIFIFVYLTLCHSKG